MEKLPDDVTADQRERNRAVRHFLVKYDDIFSMKHKTSPTSLTQYSIDTADHRTIKQGLHRHPMARLDEKVDELMRNDFVKLAARLWALNPRPS